MINMDNMILATIADSNGFGVEVWINPADKGSLSAAWTGFTVTFGN